MTSLQTHPAIPQYQTALAAFKAQGHTTESQTRQFFQRLLEDLSKERDLQLVPEWPVGKNNRKKIDGAVKAADTPFPLGFWEAKDEGDKLEIEVQKPRAIGYPTKNTIFEDTQRAFLWQNEEQIGEFDLAVAADVGDLLDRFFGTTEADREGFDEAVRDFIKRVPREPRRSIAKLRTNARNPNLGPRSPNFTPSVRARSIPISRPSRSKKCSSNIC